MKGIRTILVFLICVLLIHPSGSFSKETRTFINLNAQQDGKDISWIYGIWVERYANDYDGATYVHSLRTLKITPREIIFSPVEDANDETPSTYYYKNIDESGERVSYNYDGGKIECSDGTVFTVDIDKRSIHNISASDVIVTSLKIGSGNNANQTQASIDENNDLEPFSDIHQTLDLTKWYYGVWNVYLSTSEENYSVRTVVISPSTILISEVPFQLSGDDIRYVPDPNIAKSTKRYKYSKTDYGSDEKHYVHLTGENDEHIAYCIDRNRAIILSDKTEKCRVVSYNYAEYLGTDIVEENEALLADRDETDNASDGTLEENTSEAPAIEQSAVLENTLSNTVKYILMSLGGLAVLSVIVLVILGISRIIKIHGSNIKAKAIESLKAGNAKMSKLKTIAAEKSDKVKEEFRKNNSFDEEYQNIKKRTFEEAKSARENNKNLPLKKRIWSSKWCYTSAYHFEEKHPFWAKSVSTILTMSIGLILSILSFGGIGWIIDNEEMYGLIPLAVIIASVGTAMFFSFWSDNWGKQDETSLGLIFFKSIHAFIVITLVLVIAAVVAVLIIRFFATQFSDEGSSSSSRSSLTNSSASSSDTKKQGVNNNPSYNSGSKEQSKKSEIELPVYTVKYSYRSGSAIKRERQYFHFESDPSIEDVLRKLDSMHWEANSRTVTIHRVVKGYESNDVGFPS